MKFRYFSRIITILTRVAPLSGLSLLLLATAFSAQTDNKRTFRVLVLYWDNKDFPGNIKFDESFRAALQSSSSGNIEYYPEYLETTRFPGQDPAFFRDYLRQKYAGRVMDVVVANADPPLNFLIKYRADLFPNAPIIFVSNQPPGSDVLAAGPGMTGIAHQSTHAPTLDLALNLQPDTRHVFVISGSPEHDKRFETAARQELSRYENRVEINYLTDLPLNELSSRLASLPPKSIAFYIWQQTTDDQGRLLETYEVLSRIAPKSSAPIYGMGSGNLGLGIIGGYLQGPENNGGKIATMVLRIMAGTRVQDVRLENAPTLAMFDWRQLRRWGINEKDLPPGSVIRFREVSLWELYKWYIIGLIAAVIVEAMLIAWLLFLRRRRRQAELENERLAREAEAQHKQLDEVVSDVPGLVWEARLQPGINLTKTTFISDYVEKMLGYTPAEWISQPPGFGLRLIPDDDERDRADEASKRAIASGKPGFSEHRWIAKDGRIVWVESHLSPILDSTGKVVGLRGVTLDITERKLAEHTVQKTEERSRAILEVIPDLMFLQTRDGMYLDLHYSDAAKLIVPPKEYLGKNMRDILPVELAEKFHHHFQRAIDTAETQIVEYELTMNGERRWYESRLLCCGENILSVVRDITERREAELALSKSEGRLRLAQEAARVGTWEWHLPTGESIWSDMIWELLGLEPDDRPLRGDKFVEFIHRDDRERAWNKISQVISEGDEYYDEFRIVRKDEEVVWLSSQGRVFRAADGTPERMIGVNVDISRRKFAEDTARETQQKDTAILNAIPDLMFLQTRDGVYLDYHAKNPNDLLISPEQFLGKNMRDVLPTDLTEKFAYCFQRVSKDNSPQIIEYQIALEGAERWFEARIVGSGENVLTVVRDVTDRKKSEEALRVAHEEVSRLKNQLQEENIYLREEINLERNFGEIVGQSNELRYVLFKIEQVAPTDTTVLITGETGTGKELVARAIHNASGRRERPLVRVNCAALSPSLIESEFFGHEKGAFTGASARKIGRFELADGATIFLDEIGELPTELQVKLLRVIQEGEFERLGSSRTIKADVRIIAATNRNLDLDVRKGLFREDLWYRLNVFPITVPPLRERREDVPLLVEHFVRMFAQKQRKVITSVAPNTLKSLRNYSWPGNVRELANVIERAVINSHGSVLRIFEDFAEPATEKLDQTKKTLEELERDYIVRILNESGWRIEGRHGAARILGINPSTLRARMVKLGIQKPGHGFSVSAGKDSG